jgi:hypothetical protein
MFHGRITLLEKVAPLKFRKIKNFPKFAQKCALFLKKAKCFEHFRKIFNFPKIRRRNPNGMSRLNFGKLKIFRNLDGALNNHFVLNINIPKRIFVIPLGIATELLEF